MAFPPSICLIWESDHVTWKSSRKVAGLPVVGRGRANASIKSEREAIAFLKVGYIYMAMVGWFRKKDKRMVSFFEYDLEEELGGELVYIGVIASKGKIITIKD
jgi:hypothetical protein